MMNTVPERIAQRQNNYNNTILSDSWGINPAWRNAAHGIIMLLYCILQIYIYMYNMI